jgi:hypothetical protein
MRFKGWVVCCFLGACGGDAPEDTAAVPQGECALQGTSLGSVSADTWPAGLADGIAHFKNIGGLWQTDECGDTDDAVDVKITLPSEEAIQVLDGPPAEACGCLADPHFGDDNALVPIAFAPGAQLFVDDFSDDAIDNMTQEVDVLFFEAGQDLVLRLCSHYTVDPALGSDFTNAAMIVRVEPAGVLSGTLLMEDAAGSEICDLGSWVQISR